MNRDQLWVAGVLALLTAIFVGECVYAVTADYQPPAEQNESDYENSSIVIEPSQDGIEITDGCTDGNSGKNEPPVTGPVLELGGINSRMILPGIRYETYRGCGRDHIYVHGGIKICTTCVDEISNLE